MMKLLQTAVLISLSALFCVKPALARDWVLIDASKGPQNWQINSRELGLKIEKPFSVRLRLLHGGRQEDVSIIEIDTGAMKISVVPTRGMNVLEAVAGNVRLGWDSPVDEVVNPAFINLDGRGGLGWVEGFNEMVARCGYEWVGHAGMDRGVMLSVHGRAANTPASKVVLSIDERPPYAIHLKGELKEQAFKQVNFLIETELTTEAGARSFSLHDTLINKDDYSQEYQALYHSNFGPPLLEKRRKYWAIGRPTDRPPGITTRRCITSCLTQTNRAIPWSYCITPAVRKESAWPSMCSNCRFSRCGRTPIL